MRRVTAVVMAVVLAASAACSGGDATKTVEEAGQDAASSSVPDLSTVPGAPAGDVKPWTVFVYMAADNDLEAAAVADIAEMQAGVTDQMNLVVLMDRAVGYTDEPVAGIGDWTGVRLLHITPQGTTDLQVRGDVTMTDPAVLVQTGELVFTRFPAQQQALVFWDHANGWDGFATDDSGGGIMTPDEIASGLGEMLSRSGLGRLSLIAFDTCLMSQYEVAAAMVPFTDRMLASAEVVPGHGLDYSVIGQATLAGPDELATVMMDGFVRQAQASGTDLTVTFSLLDLTAVSALGAALGGLRDALAADPGASVEFLRAVDASQAYGYIPQQGVDLHLRDLGQIAAALAASGSSAAAAAAAVDAAVTGVVLKDIEGASYAGARGLSVYAPLSIADFRSEFTSLSTAVDWSGVLDAAYNGGADAVSGVDTSFVGEPVAEVTASGEIAIATQVDPAAISTLTDITVFYGAFVPEADGFPDLCLLLGQGAGEVVDAASGFVGGVAALYQLGLSVDGGASGLLGVFAPVPGGDGSSLLLSVPVLYIPPGGTSDTGAPGYLLLAVQGGQVVQRTLMLLAENGTIANIEPDPAGTLQTTVQQLGADGSVVPVPSEVYTDPPSLPADLAAIEIVPKPFAPGDGSVLGDNLCYGVATTDSGGTNQFVFAQYTG